MWISSVFLISYILLWSVVLVFVAVVLFLGRQIGNIYQRLGPAGAMMANPGPELNASVDRITLEDVDGKSVTIGGMRKRRSLLVFVSPGCSSCAELASGIRAISHHERDSLEVVLVSMGIDPVQNQEFRKRHSLLSLPYVVSPELRTRMNITTVPYALLLDEEGVLRSKGIVNSLSHLESLLNTIDLGYRSVQELASKREAARA